ncbi:MAG TPA: hypothetical protein VE860_28665 [Chthoniobacterales bacterium]|jgi:hypothetical protein|nr:hypothetical protein [Chthoniobacterales bacterium]
MNTIDQLDGVEYRKVERAWTSLHVSPTESDRQNFDAVCAKYGMDPEETAAEMTDNLRWWQLWHV